VNSSMPRVTVCLPVRNGVLTICRTLDSILAQDNSSLEIIVSDNCSTDKTIQIVGECAARGAYAIKDLKVRIPMISATCSEGSRPRAHAG